MHPRCNPTPTEFDSVMPLPSAASRWNPIQVRLGTYGMLQHLPLKKYLQSLSQQWSHWWNGSSSPDDAQQLDAIVLEDRILYSATPLMIAGMSVQRPSTRSTPSMMRWPWHWMNRWPLNLSRRPTQVPPRLLPTVMMEPFPSPSWSWK